MLNDRKDKKKILVYRTCKHFSYFFYTDIAIGLLKILSNNNVEIPF